MCVRERRGDGVLIVVQDHPVDRARSVVSNT